MLPLLLSLGYASVTQAGGPWPYCAPRFLPEVGLSAPELLPDSTFGNLHFSADGMQAEDRQIVLRGSVVGLRDGQEILADELIYDETSETAHASGNVRYQDRGRLLISGAADVNVATHSGQVGASQFWIGDAHIRGEAGEIILVNDNVTQLTDTRFTACDSGANDWWLKASHVTLNTETGVGIAHHARIQFMHVPIFYTPYISFPIDARRKTGILIPTVGDDTESGTELVIPYYWNIAPQYDATLTPRWMSKRGVLLDTQFRYLNERSHGEIEAAYLDSDKVYGDDRAALSVTHQGEPAPGWQTELVYRYVSDGAYLDDFNTDLNTTSTTHLQRLARAAYQSAAWRSELRLQGYQTLEETTATDQPYDSLPQLTFSTREFQAANDLSGAFTAEAVKFARDDSVTGARLDLQPRLSWPLRGAPGFVVPTLKYRYTQYWLDDQDPASAATPRREAPVFSIDSGLVFERDLDGDTRAVLQTLEPRLYYLYVPYRDQSGLIVDEDGNPQVFDSSQSTFGYNQLFRDNRFTGADRLGDANQLSAALTTRFLDEQGRELLSASVGRSYYFRDREVTLPGELPETAAASDWIGELRSQWSEAISARATLQLASADREMENATLDLRYLHSQRQALRVAYRFEREEKEQLDLAAIWPLTAQWNAMGRWLYSLRDELTLESLAGVEYETCCWSVRLVNQLRRTLSDDLIDAGDLKKTFWVQLELKGLTSVGRRVDELIAREILAP